MKILPLGSLGYVASLLCSNPLSQKFLYERQSLEYRSNCDIYTSYACADGMLLPINEKFNWKIGIICVIIIFRSETTVTLN